MSNHSDIEILQRAAAKGLITKNDIKMAQAQAMDGTYSALEFLVEINLLSQSMITTLENELDNDSSAPRYDHTKILQEEPVSPGTQGFSDQSPGYEFTDNFSESIKVTSPESSFPANWDRYHLVSFIGEGGMGRVYRANDPRLKRDVAIKFLRGADPDAQKRFLKEAQAQARVSHANLCRVFEVGEVDGRPYIAMEYVDGLPLGKIANEMVLEQKLVVIRDVAVALQEAHRTGLIHRDIKPSNIMVERTATGFKPYVLDFGLAREQSAPAMTATGAVIGTPHYMPPEQARGEIHRLDRRTDVYSLGATLYELLCGKPPFAGMTSINVLFKVINDDPDPPSKFDPTIPEDAETIALKCMEKEASHRYDSARALADDLDRYLNGDPIQGRRAGLFYRLRKRAAKNKVTVTIGALAFLGLTFALGWVIREKTISKQRTSLAVQFGAEVHDIEERLRLIHLVPRHDIRQQRKDLIDRIESIKPRINEVGKLGVGPGNYALGRGYLAMEQYDKAMEHLNVAWQNNYREPECAYALGRALGAQYQVKLQAASLISKKENRDSERQRIEDNYRKPALEYLRQVEGEQVDSPQYVKALLSFYEEDYATALFKASEVARSSDWLYEAHQLLGQIYMARGNDFKNTGDYEPAHVNFAKAEAALLDAADIGRSDPSIYVDLAELRNSLINLSNFDLQDDIEKHFKEGIKWCRAAWEVDAENSESYRIASALYLSMARAQNKRGNDPQAWLDKAIEHADKALRLNPNHPETLTQIGSGYALQAEFLMLRDINPNQSIQKAIDAYTNAASLQPSYTNYNRLGLVFRTLAIYERSKGIDPTANWDNALKAFEEAGKLQPNLVGSHNNLGMIYFHKARREIQSGEKASLNINKSIEAYSRVLEINPNLPITSNNLALVHLLQAEELELRGLDQKEAIENALKRVKHSLEKKPDHINSLKVYGEANLLKAGLAFAMGENPEAALEEAIEVNTKIYAVNRNDTDALNNLGNAYQKWAEFDMAQAKDASAKLARAHEMFDKSLESHEGRLGLRGKGFTYLTEAKYTIAQGKDPSTHLEKGLAMVHKLEQLNSYDYFCFLLMGQLYLAKAEWNHSQAKNPSEQLAFARKALTRAYSLNPNALTVRLNLAAFHLFNAQWALSKQTAPPDDFSQVKNLLDQTRQSGTHPKALALRAHAYFIEAQMQKSPEKRSTLITLAKTNLEDALGLNPYLFAEFTHLRQRINSFGP